MDHTIRHLFVYLFQRPANLTSVPVTDLLAEAFLSAAQLKGGWQSLVMGLHLKNNN